VVLNKEMRLSGKIFLLVAFIFSFSCEDQGLIVRCPDCKENEPSKTELELKLNLSDNRSLSALITVYEGNIEDNIIYDTFQTKDENSSITVPLNKKYTVTATYTIPDNSYIAVDSATPKVRFEKSQCDNPCYFVYDRILDLRLKYTK
jgi:hypothetical protein